MNIPWYLILIPIILSGTLHMVVVKLDYFTFLKRPINAQLFGKNKTYRGAFIMTIFNSVIGMSVWPLIPKNSISFKAWGLLNLLTGFGYVLGELPNSYYKRRIGLKEGDANKLTTILDQLDSFLMISLLLLFTNLEHLQLLLFLLISPNIAFLYKKVLYRLNLKKVSR